MRLDVQLLLVRHRGLDERLVRRVSIIWSCVGRSCDACSDIGGSSPFSRFFVNTLSLDQVDDGEQDDPDQVDEVPVEPDQLDRAVVVAACTRRRSDWIRMQVSMITPPVTWAPWNPVIVKKQDANRLTLGRKWPVALMPGG